MKTNNGFTLVELLVVVAIVGILASIAYPSYTSYVLRGKIQEGTSTLSDGRVKMEQFFMDNRTYSSASLAANGCPTTLKVPASTTNFAYSCSGLSTTAYKITATGNFSSPAFVFTIDQSNTKQTTAAPSGWAAATMPTNCWISKKGGVC
jgi:type IV pilus assembly protein PilE